MLAKFLFSLRRSIWLLALLFITSALPASAQDEFYGDSDFQEFQFNFEYSDDLNGYIVSPTRVGVRSGMFHFSLTCRQYAYGMASLL